MPKLTLLAKFSATSFVLLAAIGVLLGVALTRHFEQQAIDQQKVGVSALVPPVIGPHLTPGLLANGAHGESYNDLEAALSYLGGSGLVRVEIWNRAGMVVYSDYPSLIGTISQRDGRLQQALDGVPAAAISPASSAAKVDERGYGELLQVYTPLRMPGRSDVSAVFGGYYDVDDLVQTIDTTARFLWGSIAVGFLFLYISLFTIVRNASLRLVHQSQENAELYQKARRRLAQREEAERKTQLQMERLKALRNIDMAIASNLDQRLTLQVILTQVCTQLCVDGAAILLLNGRTGVFEYAASRGLDPGRAHLLGSRPGESYRHLGAGDSSSPIITQVEQLEESPFAVLLSGEGFVACSAAPLVVKGQTQGLLEIYNRSALQPDREWLGFFETLAGQAAIAVENATLFHELQRSNRELSRAYDSTLEGWARALELRDAETEGHSRRVTETTLGLARLMGVPEDELVHVRRGALLHDIGKMGVPDAVLLKPGPLSAEEWKVMQEHPTHAYHLLSPVPFLRSALDIPYCHHEKWDGSGYPRGLRGEQIPLGARIFAVVDVWDALTSDRPYRKALGEEVVYDYLRQESGRHFDPAVVTTFLAMQGAQDAVPVGAGAWEHET